MTNFGVFFFFYGRTSLLFYLDIILVENFKHACKLFFQELLYIRHYGETGEREPFARDVTIPKDVNHFARDVTILKAVNHFAHGAIACGTFILLFLSLVIFLYLRDLASPVFSPCFKRRHVIWNLNKHSF